MCATSALSLAICLACMGGARASGLRHRTGAPLELGGDMLRVPLRRGARPEPEGPAAGALSLLQTSSTVGSGGVSSSIGPPPVDIYGEIRIGVPEEVYTIAFDTSSGNLMIPSASCKDLGCLAHKAYSTGTSATSTALTLVDAADPSAAAPDYVTLAISTGEAKGSPVEDVVCLGATGGVCAKTAFLLLSSMSQEPWANFPYDGILGIGMPSASMDRRFNFLGNLAEAGLLKRNRFAVWLANENDGGEESEITFGDFDTKRVGSEVLWLPVSRTDTGMWQATMKDIVVGGVEQSLCGTDGCEAAFDTGTSVIAGPKGMINGLITQLDVQEDCSNFASLPTLGFYFRMYVLNLEPKDYVKKGPSGCFHQLLGIDVPPPKGPVVLLGDPFLKRYFTIYDRDSLKVGVAFSNHKTPPGTTLATKSAQLMVQVAA